MDPSDFVGLPWQDRGRNFAGADCWGLFRLAFTAGTGIALPSYATGYRSAADREETARVMAGEVGDWLPIAEGSERRFDAAVMVVQGRFHVGLVVSRGTMLHMKFRGTSVIEPWAHRYRLEALYRHRSLAGDGDCQRRIAG